eukprot:424166_1
MSKSLDKGCDIRGKILNSENNQYVEVIGQCKYRSSSIANQKSLSLKELDRIASTIQLQSSSIDKALGIIITNVSMSSAALSHFNRANCSPLIFIRMAINDSLLFSLFGINEMQLTHQLHWAENEQYSQLKNGVYINQILINTSITKLLPNACVSRVLLPQNQ